MQVAWDMQLVPLPLAVELVLGGVLREVTGQGGGRRTAEKVVGQCLPGGEALRRVQAEQAFNEIGG